jgi:hypothetical protein
MYVFEWRNGVSEEHVKEVVRTWEVAPNKEHFALHIIGDAWLLRVWRDDKLLWQYPGPIEPARPRPWWDRLTCYMPPKRAGY